MKIDFNTVLKEKNGDPIKDEIGEVTLAKVSEIALLASFADEATAIDGAEKVRRFKLAMKLSGETEIEAEEAALIKKLVAKAFGPMIVGRAYELLDG